MTNVKATSGNYVNSVWWGVVDSSSYLIGNSATAPSAGDQDGATMAQLVGVQDFPFAPQDADRPTQLGDGGALTRFINAPTELPGATSNFGAYDKTFAAVAQELVVVDVGGGSMLGRNPKNPTFADILFLVYSPTKSKDSATLNASSWECMLVLKSNVSPKGRNSYATNALPTYSYDMVANFASALPWGTAFASGTHGDTEFALWDFDWPYKPILQRWTGDGLETTFNLSKNIASDAATNIVVFVNGTAQTWVTGVPSAGEFGVTEGATDTIVLGTAPASSAKVVALYGWS